jgi:phage terminase Nu1 subunit (DNA packaging protein)
MEKIGLAPQEAEMLLRRDLANIVKRTAVGSPLTASQRALVTAYLAGKDLAGASHVQTIVELAQALGCDRRTVQRHLKREGNPGRKPDGRYDVAAWRTYLAQFGGVDEDEFEELEPQLRSKLMAVKVAMAELELDRQRGELVSVDSVRQLGAELGAAIRKTLSVHRLASSLVGLGVREIEDRLKEAEDETLRQLHLLDQRLGAWQAGPADDVPDPSAD